MEQNPSSKHPTTMTENGRWIFLPDEILEIIVSCLDIPGITISSTTFKIEIFENIPGLWSILDNLFTMFCSPLITNFSVQLHYTVYEEPCSSTILNSWVRFLRACNIQQCKLKGSYPSARSNIVYQPWISFRVHSLVSLDLDFCVILTLFHSITLPNLKKLKLDRVNCYRSLERILRFCPSLESLSLTIVDQPHQKGKKGSILIACENLMQLNIVLYCQYITEVMIDCPQLESFRYVSNFLLPMEKSLDTISHVKSLEIYLSFSWIMVLDDPIKSVFPNLTHLKIRVGQCEVFRSMCYMFDCCPNLETLELHFVSDFKRTPWSPEDMIGSIIEHVKQVTVQCDYPMLNLVKYMLSSASALKKLIIIGSFSCNDLSSQFYQSLLECPKASSTCEIEFL